MGTAGKAKKPPETPDPEEREAGKRLLRCVGMPRKSRHVI
jgi:hypothetical protein